MAPEQSWLALRRMAAVRGSVDAIRHAAATAELLALTYDDVASSAGMDPPGAQEPRQQRTAWRAKAEQERREARRMWRQAAAMERASR